MKFSRRELLAGATLAWSARAGNQAAGAMLWDYFAKELGAADER